MERGCTGQRSYDDAGAQLADGGDRLAAGALQGGTLAGDDVVAAHLDAGFDEIRRHGGTHGAEADHADRDHFFFFLGDFFFEETGFALTSTAATMHGSLVRTLHEWLVPRCTRTSPARSSFSPVSRMA